MRLRLSNAITTAALAVSQSGLAVAAGQKDFESRHGTTNAAELSQTRAATSAASSVPLMAFAFNGASKELGGIGPNPVVNFDYGDMYLINLDAAQTNREEATFTWTMSSTIGNVNVTAVGLCKVGDSGNCDLAWSKLHPQTDSEEADDDFLVVADPSDGVTSGGTTFWSKSGQIAVHTDSDVFELAYRNDLHTHAMFIQINWININNPSASGKSYSPFFAIYDQVNDTRGYATELLGNASVRTGRSGLAEEQGLSPDSVNFITPPSPANTDSSGTTVSSNTGGAGAGTGAGDSSPSSEKASSSGSGLATGAIAGIAVGCGAAGIVAAAVLLWLCMRRKRRSNTARRASKTDAMDHVHDGYDTMPANHEFMADKETHPRATESPQPPYLDNIALGVTTGAAATAGGPSNDRSYTPYGDPPSPIQQHSSLRHSAHAPSPIQSMGPTSAPVAPGHDLDAPRVGSTTPHGLSRSFAALVEEGMTDDEIRRLEEEERALDAAIEQAERNR